MSVYKNAAPSPVETAPAPALQRRAPRLPDLEHLARRRLPSFCFDFLQGGTGSETSRPHNLAAFESIRILPRYGGDMAGIDTATTLLGVPLAAPLIIAPVGMDGAIWPGAGPMLAQAARTTGIGYMPGSLATTSVEEIARHLPDRLFFQLYGMPENDHRLTLDLARRAEQAGARALAVTLDIPLPGRRVRDLRNGLSLPVRLTPRIALDALRRPAWLAALARAGRPRFANMAAYCPAGATNAQIARFVRDNRAGSGVTWETLARLRQSWTRPLLVKGILHPADALRAQALGLDGVILSNHGGRQFDAAPAPVDVLPAIRAAVGPQFPLILDSGVMSGLDILRAVAVGADAVMVGRGFMLGLAAFGAEGGLHVARMLIDEFRIALGQTGALTVAGARGLDLIHPGAWQPGDFKTDTGAADARQERKTA